MFLPVQSTVVYSPSFELQSKYFLALTLLLIIINAYSLEKRCVDFSKAVDRI